MIIYLTIGSTAITERETEAGWNKHSQHADTHEKNKPENTTVKFAKV